MKARMLVLGLVGLLAAFASQSAQAAVYTYTFKMTEPTNNDQPYKSVESQLFLRIEDAGANQVNLSFYNIGGVQSSITDVFFDEGSSILPGAPGITETASIGRTVEFSNSVGPVTVPTGIVFFPGPTIFIPDIQFTTEADANSSLNGVNNNTNNVPGLDYEYVTLTFNGTGLDADDINTALLSTNPTTQLRIVVNVTGFQGGPMNDRTYYVDVASPYFGDLPSLPEPATMTMWGLGMAACGLMGFAKSRSKKAAA